MNHKLHRFSVFLSILIISAASFTSTFFIPIYSLISEENEKAFLTDILSFAYINLFRMFFAFQFGLSCAAIRKRFHALNGHLMHFTEKRSVMCFRFELNEKFRKNYLKLCDGIQLINETFTLPFVTIFGILLVRFSQFSFSLKILILESIL